MPGKTTPASFRLEQDLLEELRRRAGESGVPTTALLERYLREGLRQDAHPLIVFRSGPAGRRAVLAGTRVEVAQVIDAIHATAATGDAAVQETTEYLQLTDAQVRACVSYYASYAREIDEWRERLHEIAGRERSAWIRLDRGPRDSDVTNKSESA